MSQYNSFDPLTVLSADELPVQPDPAFATALRTRLETALTLPNQTEGVVMSGTTEALAELSEPAQPTAPPRPAALPYLTVADARGAIAWYVDAFGGVVVGEPIVMDDGRIGHAELAIAGGVLYLTDEYPELGLKAPAAQATSVSLMLHVPDTDVVLDHVRQRGATVEQEASENYGARMATVVDPFGHRWMLSGPVIGAVSQIRHGDIGYVSVWTPDADRAAAFYSRVLGWIYDPRTHQVTNTAERIGISSASNVSTLFCCYAVNDVAATRAAIIDAGGNVGEVEEYPYGSVLDATDPSGTAFAVYQPAAGQARPDLNGAGPGELSYVTYRVGDSTAFREFYGQVLHWTFDPGQIADGWEPVRCHPMAGIAGGNATTATVPMWTVSDIESAVARVREAGGTVIQEPLQQSYGLMAECADDQGGRFYLGEF